MLLVCISFFSEPGVSFNVSYKVDNFIRDVLRKEIMNLYELDKLNDGWFLSYSITTNSKTFEVSVKGPEINKRGKRHNWGIWLPYRLIVEKKDINDAYIKYLFQGLAQMFTYYGVLAKDVFKIEEIIRKEIIGNTLYDYQVKQTKEGHERLEKSIQINESKLSDKKQQNEQNWDSFTPGQISDKAKELLKAAFFWDTVDEFAPFGSDEGAQAYEEWKEWRKDHPKESLNNCLSWLLDDEFDNYNETILSNEKIKERLDDDIFSIDATIIATALGQLIDEGKIDSEGKPIVLIAIERQLHPLICLDIKRKDILLAIKRVVVLA